MDILENKFDNNGRGLNGKSSTCSLQEFFNNRGFVVDFENKVIFKYLKRNLSNWDLDYLQKTYISFNINEFNIIETSILKIENFLLQFDAEKNIFQINDRKFNIENTLDLYSQSVKIFKKKLICYNGIQGLFSNILYIHNSFWGAEKFLNKVLNY